jgi:hypothetical protein
MINTQPLVNTYAKAVQDKLHEAYAWQDAHLRPMVEVEVGRKYFKLVAVHPEGRSVHSFVDRVTGDVLKAATWAAPAKGARFNVVTGLDALLAVVEPYGGYLYKR